MRAASAFQRAFFSRRGNRDLFFLASLGIFVDFIRGAGSAAACGGAAFFLAALSVAFASFTEPPSAAFFLSAINVLSSGESPGEPAYKGNISTWAVRLECTTCVWLRLAWKRTLAALSIGNYPEVGPAPAFEEVWQNCSRDAESPQGISPRGAHRSGREPLDSSGSCHPVKAAAFRQDRRFLPLPVDLSISTPVTCPLRSTGITPLLRY